MTDRATLALEGAWWDIRDRHANVPHVVILAGMADKGGCGGYFGTTADGTLVVNIAHSRIYGGNPGGTLATLLHEAAHAVMWAESGGTLSGDQWEGFHTWRFAQAAERLGLVAPWDPDPTDGFSFCTLSPAARRDYAATLARLRLLS